MKKIITTISVLILISLISVEMAYAANSCLVTDKNTNQFYLVDKDTNKIYLSDASGKQGSELTTTDARVKDSVSILSAAAGTPVSSFRIVTATSNAGAANAQGAPAAQTAEQWIKSNPTKLKEFADALEVKGYSAEQITKIRAGNVDAIKAAQTSLGITNPDGKPGSRSLDATKVTTIGNPPPHVSQTSEQRLQDVVERSESDLDATNKKLNDLQVRANRAPLGSAERTALFVQIAKLETQKKDIEAGLSSAKTTLQTIQQDRNDKQAQIEAQRQQDAARSVAASAAEKRIEETKNNAKENIDDALFLVPEGDTFVLRDVNGNNIDAFGDLGAANKDQVLDDKTKAGLNSVCSSCDIVRQDDGDYTLRGYTKTQGIYRVSADGEEVTHVWVDEKGNSHTETFEFAEESSVLKNKDFTWDKRWGKQTEVDPTTNLRVISRYEEGKVVYSESYNTVDGGLAGYHYNNKDYIYTDGKLYEKTKACTSGSESGCTAANARDLGKDFERRHVANTRNPFATSISPGTALLYREEAEKIYAPLQDIVFWADQGGSYRKWLDSVDGFLGTFLGGVFGGRKAWITNICEGWVRNPNAPSSIAPGADGSAAAHIEGERIAGETDVGGVISRTKIYKITGSLTPRAIMLKATDKTAVRIFVKGSSEKEILKSEFTGESDAISYTGQNAIIFETNDDYDTVCMQFTDPGFLKNDFKNYLEPRHSNADRLCNSLIATDSVPAEVRQALLSSGVRATSGGLLK